MVQSSPEQYGQLREIFRVAIEQKPPQRAAYLDQACGGDAVLRAEIESLLASHDDAEHFIETPAFARPLRGIAEQNEDPIEGRLLGSYQLIREIGRGGMGTVYLAQRADEQYQKLVAIKVVRRGMDTADILRRFRSERQILASLEHPNIARLIDGGTTDEGLPYLVMEYVEGTRVTDYCDHHRLSTNERLQIFQTICAAVQHAHQHLVVHRDLKPSNILIMADGTPKLLDFGIARVLVPETSELGMEHTNTELRVLTPDYASPEQVRGEKLATTSDIYTLGVVLYELLTGHRPYHATGATPLEMARVICEEQPAKPSDSIAEFGLRNSDFKSAPNGEPKNNPQSAIRNSKFLRGDLDNIILMALRKEPGRRYDSAAQLAMDIQRYLEGLPVIAHKATFKYRTAKFVQRNRLGVAAAAIISLALLGGIVATAWQARAARQEKDKAESISAFLGQILNSTNPVVNVPRDNSRERTITEVLDEAAKRLESEEFANQPEVKAELERLIGSSYGYQGRYDLAIKHLQEYVTIQSGLNAANHPKTLEASAIAANLLFSKGDLKESESIFRQVLPLMRNEHQKGNIKAETLANSVMVFGQLRRTQGDSKEAESLFRETLALSARIPRESRYIVELTRSTLASTIADQGRFEEALRTAREAVDEFRQTGPN